MKRQRITNGIAIGVVVIAVLLTIFGRFLVWIFPCPWLPSDVNKLLLDAAEGPNSTYSYPENYVPPCYVAKLIKLAGIDDNLLLIEDGAGSDTVAGDYCNIALFHLRDQPESRLRVILGRIDASEGTGREKLILRALTPFLSKSEDGQYAYIITDYMSALEEPSLDILWLYDDMARR